MAKKVEDIKLNYDTLWFKIFMDSGDITFYNKEIYLTESMKMSFDQIVGNIGGIPRHGNLNKEVNVVIVSDMIMADLKENRVHPIISELESAINDIKTPHRKLKFTTENLFKEYLKLRATGNIKSNTEDLESNDTSDELRIKIKQAIDRDELLLDLLAVKPKKRNEPIQQSLF